MTRSTVDLVDLVERDGGNYRAEDATHVRALADAIDRGAPVPVPAVTIDQDGRYVIVSGHHRIAAHRLLGRHQVDVDLVDVASSADLLAEQLAENACRLAPSAAAEADAFSELVAAGWTAETVATRVGRTAPYVRRRLALLEIDPT